MHPDLAQALHVQQLDLRIAALRQEIATLPRQIAEIEKLLYSHIRKLELDKATLSANQKDRKKFEGDTQQHEQKISKLKDQMMQARTNEQLWAFQKEIGFVEAEISKCEDRILELMVEAERLEGVVRTSEEALAEEKKSVDARKAEATARTDADRKELAAAAAERAAAAASIPHSLLQNYERLRVRHKDGLAIAEAADGICLGCRLTLRPQLFYDLRQGDQILACENCRRLLYVAPRPADVAGEMNV